MGDLGMPDLHGHGSQSASDVADPVVTAQRGEGLCDGFVEGLGGHVDRVRGLVQIVDNDGTGFESHDGNLSYSPFVRLLAWPLTSRRARSDFEVRGPIKPGGHCATV